jgi:hypothetical protein
MKLTAGHHLQNWLIANDLDVTSADFVPSVNLAIKNARSYDPNIRDPSTCAARCSDGVFSDKTINSPNTVPAASNSGF